MKNLILLLATVTLAFSTATFAKGKHEEPTPEQRQKMADHMDKMSACLRSDKSMKECHETMKKDCEAMGKDCPMKGMMGKMMGMHGHHDGEKCDHADGETCDHHKDGKDTAKKDKK
jgi:hypothetical protein